jgi:hypothetical protein
MFDICFSMSQFFTAMRSLVALVRGSALRVSFALLSNEKFDLT